MAINKIQQKDFMERVHYLKRIAWDSGCKVTGLFLGAEEYELASDFIQSVRLGNSSEFTPMLHNMDIYKVDRQSYFEMLIGEKE